MGLTKWDKRFLKLAKLIATFSKDPSTKVGAVIVRPDRTICSLGFNGFPRGVNDSPTLYADKELKHQIVVHAELNALLNCREGMAGHTLYVWPVMPCSRCSSAIIQAGIKRVVSPNQRSKGKVLNYDLTSALFTQAGVEFILV